MRQEGVCKAVSCSVKNWGEIHSSCLSSSCAFHGWENRHKEKKKIHCHHKITSPLSRLEQRRDGGIHPPAMPNAGLWFLLTNAISRATARGTRDLKVCFLCFDYGDHMMMWKRVN